MLGSALYYPYIDISDGEWLRSAILFWDEIKTIVPRAIKEPYVNEDTNILWKEGFLAPLRCDLHPDLLDALGKRVVGLMDRDFVERNLGLDRLYSDPNANTLVFADEIGMDLRDQFYRAHIHPEKLSPDLRDIVMRAGLARMHSEKLSPELRDLVEDIQFTRFHPEKLSSHLRHLMRRTDRFMDSNEEWLLIDSRFAEIYMSALAAILAKETDITALTDKEPSMGVNLHTLIEDVKPHGPMEKKGALVSFIMESISIDPDTRIDKLVSFRQNRRNQLAELSAQFDDISSKIANCENSIDLEGKIRDTYVTKIRPKLESLKKELHDSHIQAIWEGVQRAVTITVPAGSAMAYVGGQAGTVLIAAGAAIAVTDVAVKAHLACRKTRRASPYTYLLDIKRKFSKEVL